MRTDLPRERRGVRARVPAHLVFLACVFVSGLAFLSAHRAIFWLAVKDRSDAVPWGVLLRAFGMGVRFDAAVSAYLLAGPLILLSALGAAGFRARVPGRLLTWALGAGYASVFLLTSADIPWFRRFGARISVAALGWTDTPGFMLDSTLGDPASRPYLVLFVGTTALFGLLLGRLRRRVLERAGGEPTCGRARRAVSVSAWSIAALALLFLAARGRIAVSSPLRTGTAFFSSHPLANQLGLNPAFTFWNSVIEARSESAGRAPWMPREQAIEDARRFLGVPTGGTFASPLARLEKPGGPPRDPNVVIVLMEGMAAGHLSRHGGSGLTPRLDDLAARSLVFDRVFAAGLHTYAGVYATLFSLPALPGEHPMKGARSLQPYTGLARTLEARGYSTAFLCPHDAEIDNMGGFLGNNGYASVLDLDDWPRELRLPNRRVPDHELFDLALGILRELGSRGKPFLASILTVSNHPRHYLPAGIPFRPRSEDAALRMVEYADWSLGRFLDAASREPWFEKTLFVLVADHGASLESGSASPLARHHVPLILFAPALLGEPRAVDALGGQIDVGPTVLGLLGRSWVNNTLGVDLLRERRPAIYFSDDEAVVCFDGRTSLVRRRDGSESVLGPAPVEEGTVDRLRRYALSMLESARFLVERNLAGPEPDARAR